jgi:hypothetical protein
MFDRIGTPSGKVGAERQRSLAPWPPARALEIPEEI